MSQSEIAINKFKEGYNCAQSVFFSYAEKLNVPKDMALKIANGFGGGMGRKQEVCGAISGGILVISLIYGRGESDGKEKQGLTYFKVRELIDRFEEHFNSNNCKKLLDGCDLSTNEGKAEYNSRQLTLKCCEYVEYTVKILNEIIEKD